MKRILIIVSAFVWAGSLLAQNNPANPTSAQPVQNFSGMYNFLKEGEFVQLTVEEGRVTGFVSRYGEQESDQGAFLDQFFKEAKLEGKKLSFTTQTVHGVWYEFKGMVERGEGRNVGDEAYYVLKGKLTQYTTSADKKISSQSREVVFKAFPGDMGDGPPRP